MVTFTRAGRNLTLIGLVAALGAGPVGSAAGQATVDARPIGPGPEVPSWVLQQVPNLDDPRVQEYARGQKRRVEIEKQLYKLRADHFRNMRNVEIRQAGLSKLRTYTDPVIYPSLIKIFEGEGADVRGAIVDMLADQGTDEADTTLTWIGVFGKSKEFRIAAAERLKRRVKDNGGPTERIKTVVAQGLQPGNTNDELASAANLANTLNLVEAIPMLISAQAGGTVTRTGGSGEGALAWIMVGTQTAFVSDLTPVVGDSAVAFDPTISVITEGTYLRVIDAVVVTYRTEVHYSLIELSSRAWGQPTDRFGWDGDRWRKWYTEEFVPFWEAKKAQDAAAKVEGDGGR